MTQLEKGGTSRSSPTISLDGDDVAPEAGTGTGEASSGAATRPTTIGPSARPTAKKAGKKSGGKFPKQAKKTSIAWKHFERVADEKDAELFFITCKHCNQPYADDVNKNGTNTLLRHLKRCTHNPDNKGKGKQQTLTVKFLKGKESMTSWHFDQKKCRNALAKMVILDELPFTFVDGEGYKEYVAASCPQFEIPSRWTVARDVENFFKFQKSKLQEYFQSETPRVSLTTDTWTSVQQINYSCLTAHFITNEWVLRKEIINFIPIDSHKGDDIGKSVESCLRSWGLDKIMTVTVDNALSNDAAISYLNRRMNVLSSNLLGGRFMHMRCIAHIINLIVSDGIKMLGISIDRVRCVVRFIKNSPKRLARFKKCVILAKLDDKKLLCHDCPTRWNSTYLMLESACRLQRALEIYEEKDRHLTIAMDKKIRSGSLDILGMLTYQDWAELHSFMAFLKMFYDLTNKISGSKYVTSNCILDSIGDIFHMIKRGQISAILDMRLMADKMKVKFDKYFGNIDRLNMYIFIAPILDPRKKLLFVNHIVKTIYPSDMMSNIQDCIKLALRTLFDEYLILYSSSSDSSFVPVLSSNDVNEGDMPKVGCSFEDFRRNNSSSQEIDTSSELDKYLSDALEDGGSIFDILKWWSANCQKYPVLSKLARDILAIPISTVSSESAFSTGVG